ncbi:MAG: hypothetical protein J0H55_02425 [Chitinophagaceae bacterium]|nr:hypothetical protein [Chitinophagaceae bacterium]
MKAQIAISIFTLLLYQNAFSQEKDSVVKVENHYITLSEIIVNQNLDVASFIKRVRNDTTFYKAFKSLRTVGYTAFNNIQMLDKRGRVEASFNGETRQEVQNHCRQLRILNDKVTGKFYDSKHNYNYYTASMYGQMFLDERKVCGENNIVGNTQFSTDGLSGMEKHKAQLKMLFFNPGTKIKGLPFISGKTEIFDKSMEDDYNMRIDYDENSQAYLFSINVKRGKEKKVVIQHMTTLFDEKTFEVLERNYTLKYDAGVYDFDVNMRVKMTKVRNLLVPSSIVYNGNWKLIFKKRERGIFTATLSGFN